MKSKFVVSILLALLSCLGLSAQVLLKGSVFANPKGEPVPFAHISLRSERDSTILLQGVSDLQGGYSFDAVKVGRYRLSIHYQGYKPVDRSIRIVLPSSGHTVYLEDKLEEDARALQEVVVKGVSARQNIDHRVIRFDSKTIQESLNSFDLLKTLPFVQVDVLEDKIKGSMGGTAQILINGIRATQNDVRMLPKESIKRVELYDIPPAQYRRVEIVINIITSPLENGSQIGGTLSHAFSTGFGNDNLYASLVRGKHKLSLEYNLNYRDYRDKEEHIEYKYLLGAKPKHIQYNNRERFGYTTHSPGLKYAYLQEDRMLWEVRFRPNYEYRFSDEVGKGGYLLDGALQQSVRNEGRSRIKQFNPVIDLYHWRKLGERDELSINAVATLFSTKRVSSSQEFDLSSGQLGLDDHMDLDNSKKSLILEVAHRKSINGHNWSSGYRGEFAWLHSAVVNHFGTLDYKSKSLVHYAYSELSGRYRRLLYRLSLGLTHTTNNSSYRSYRQISFTPKVMIGYTLGSGSTLRLMYDRMPNFPDINSLSSNRERISEDIISTGNPRLENEVINKITSLYNYQRGIWDLALIGAYIDIRRPHIFISEPEQGQYLMKPVNGIWDRTLAGGLKINIKPWSNNILKLDVLLLPVHNRLRSEELNYRQNSLHTELGATLQHKGLTLYYKCVLPAYSARGGYASLGEPEHTFSIAYKLKQWRFTANLLYLGSPSHYHTYTLATPQVYTSRESWIHDNKNMITLGVSYHFSRGQDRVYSKQLNNQDTAAPTL